MKMKNIILIKKYIELKNNNILEKSLFMNLMETNNIVNEQNLINLLLKIPECSEQMRRNIQFEYKEYLKNPKKYTKQSYMNLLFFK